MSLEEPTTEKKSKKQQARELALKYKDIQNKKTRRIKIMEEIKINTIDIRGD